MNYDGSKLTHQYRISGLLTARFLLLLRAHSFYKGKRLGRVGVARLPEPQVPPPQILQPIIDMLQYEAFCDRVTYEIDKVVQGLYRSNVPTKVHFRGIGNSGAQLVSLLQNNEAIVVGGECLIRIEQRYVYFTLNIFCI